MFVYKINVSNFRCVLKAAIASTTDQAIPDQQELPIGKMF